MLARARIDLPFSIDLPPWEFQTYYREAQGYKYTINPKAMFESADDSSTHPYLLKANGDACRRTSKLIIDFYKEGFEMELPASQYGQFQIL